MAKAYLGHLDSEYQSIASPDQYKPTVVEKIVEVTKTVEVPVEVVKYVDKIVEVEKIVEVPVQVVRHIEKKVEVPVPFEVIKFVDKPVEVEKLIEVEKLVYKVPNWTKPVMAAQFLIIVGLLIFAL